MPHLYWPKELNGAPRYIFDGASAELRPVFLPDFTRQPADLLHRVLRFLVLGRVPVGPRVATWVTGIAGWEQLRQVGPGDRFMADGITNARTLQALAWMLPRGVPRFNYFNNTMRYTLPKEDIVPLLRRMKRMGYELYTFDPDDAETYDLHLTEQFYREPDLAITPAEPVDCYFCGENKGRRAELEKLERRLQAAGYTTRFLIADTSAQRIPYAEYLHHLRACRCVVDLVQGSQRGITRRPVEAIFEQKKLITNCNSILHADFYRPENIFVLGHDSYESLPNFLQQPQVPLPQDVLRRYHVNHFLENFTKHVNTLTN